MIGTGCGSSPSAGVASGDAGSSADAVEVVDAPGSPEGSASPVDAATQSADSATDQGAEAGTPDSATNVDASAAPDGATTMPVYVTFYGWADNSPPGAAIAYPKNGAFPTLHNTAGGTGTYADPITFASDRTEFAPGTRLYVPFIEKYVIMEDDCGQCDTDWTTAHKWHIDVWMNSNASESSSALIACEDAWTRAQTSVEVNPPSSQLVTTAPLFDPATNTCRTSP
jgi:3D (Asp-Asp-Asp) domain-containing protein